MFFLSHLPFLGLLLVVIFCCFLLFFILVRIKILDNYIWLNQPNFKSNANKANLQMAFEIWDKLCIFAFCWSSDECETINYFHWWQTNKDIDRYKFFFAKPKNVFLLPPKNESKFMWVLLFFALNSHYLFGRMKRKKK